MHSRNLNSCERGFVQRRGVTAGGVPAVAVTFPDCRPTTRPRTVPALSPCAMFL